MSFDPNAPRNPSETAPQTTATPDAAAALSAGDNTTVAPLTGEQLLQARHTHTHKLLRALRASSPTLSARVDGVCAVLNEGALADPEYCLLDLSLIDPHTDQPALFTLLKFYTQMGFFATDTEEDRATKTGPPARFVEVTKPLTKQLLSSFQDLANFRFEATGNNAVHELLTLTLPSLPTAWVCGLVITMVQMGVDVNGLNKAGFTPLLLAASCVGAHHVQAIFVTLLHELGANLSAQDPEGQGLLHLLLKRHGQPVMENLFTLPFAHEIDLFMENKTGQTALDLAAIILAEDENEGDEPRARAAHALLTAQVDHWNNATRPAILKLLCQERNVSSSSSSSSEAAEEQGCNPGLIPDLARIVIAYIDSSGLPFPRPSPEPSPDTAEAMRTHGKEERAE